MKIQKIKGFTLVEISIVLLIVSILMIGYTRFLRDANMDDKSAAIAAHLKTVTGGVNTYISSNFDALVTGAPVSGVANTLTPTVTELKNTGYLALNVKTQNIAGTNWLVQIQTTPSGCVAPACDLNAIVYSDKGFINHSNGNSPDWMLAARVASKVGGDGGTSLTSNTAIISGEGNTWTVPNPVAASSAAAVVAQRTGYGSQGFSQFVRNGDMRNITLNGNLSVNGASGVAATSVTASSANLGVVAASTVTASGNISGSYLNPSTVITPGTACAAGVSNGAIAKGTDGSIYSCTSGMWVSSSAVPCVHGSWSSSTPGTYAIFIPSSCTKITVSGYGGGGGGGWGMYDGSGGASGGGSTGLTTQVVNRLPAEQGTSFTAVVGAGGWINTPWTYGDAGNWWLWFGGSGQGENSYFNYSSAPTRTYAIFTGGSQGWGPNVGGSSAAGTGGFNGNPPVGYAGGAGADAPAAGGAPGGGGTAGSVYYHPSRYVYGYKQCTYWLGAPGTGTSTAGSPSFKPAWYPNNYIPGTSSCYYQGGSFVNAPTGGPAPGGNGYMSVTW